MRKRTKAVTPNMLPRIAPMTFELSELNVPPEGTGGDWLLRFNVSEENPGMRDSKTYVAVMTGKRQEGGLAHPLTLIYSISKALCWESVGRLVTVIV